jgi:hypothetical protein
MIPIIKLGNGLRVANFSSPHPFNFITGEVLPACDPDRARQLMLIAKVEDIYTSIADVPIVDIALEFSMSEVVHSALAELMARDDIDIILAPLPVLQLCRGTFYMRKVRCVRVGDRVSKAIYSDRFCI